MAKMYKVEANIRPDRFDAVRDALHDIDVTMMTVVECRGSGRLRVPVTQFRTGRHGDGLTTRLQVNIVVSEPFLQPTVDAIQRVAVTGEVGDGKIFVLEVQEVVRIRNNERGSTALS
jgi:nitrogen regulatory protein P-II 1